MQAPERLSAFVKWVGWTDAELARRVGCHQSQISRLKSGERGIGIETAFALERVSREMHWPDGPLLASEWVDAPAPSPEAP